MLKIRVCLFLLLALASNLIFSQESDFQTWVNIDMKGKLYKKVKYSLVPEIRTWDNSTRVKTMLCEISLSVPVSKYFDLGIIYRPALSKSETYSHKTNRFCLFGSAIYKIENFKLSYRLIYQQEYTDYNTSENGHLPDIQHRHKFGLKYNPKNRDISPFISTEGFFTLKPITEKEEWKLRTSIGLDYKINKDLNCSIDYKIQKEYRVRNPLTINILGISLEYEF
jgi:hypothetical protein